MNLVVAEHVVRVAVGCSNRLQTRQVAGGEGYRVTRDIVKKSGCWKWHNTTKPKFTRTWDR